MVITGRTRNALALNRARGFESHRLRQKNDNPLLGDCRLSFMAEQGLVSAVPLIQ